MAYSTKLSDSLHLLVFIATERDRDLSSTAIAKSLAANPSSVRQLMGRLRRAGLITSVTGHARPELARSAGDISMLDVYREEYPAFIRAIHEGAVTPVPEAMRREAECLLHEEAYVVL